MPSFASACAYMPAFLGIYAKQMQTLGIAIPSEAKDGLYRRYTGDSAGPGKGEILVWQPHG